MLLTWTVVPVRCQATILRASAIWFAGGVPSAPPYNLFGRVPEWTNGADCKSVASKLRGFESHRGLLELA